MTRAAKAGGGVDAGADRRAAEWQLRDPGQRRLESLDAAADLRRVAAELLAERDRRGVHQMGTPGLDHCLELGGLRAEGVGQVTERRDQLVDDRVGRGDVDRRWEDVVARLAGVDVVVGVHVLPESLRGERREHLVGVHIRRRTRAGLEDVDREVLVVRAGGHLLGDGPDRVGHVLRDHAELAVDRGGRALHQGQGLDVIALQRRAGDREVLHRPLGLGPPQGVLGDPNLPHRVVLDPVLGVVFTHAWKAIDSGSADRPEVERVLLGPGAQVHAASDLLARPRGGPQRRRQQVRTGRRPDRDDAARSQPRRAVGQEVRIVERGVGVVDQAVGSVVDVEEYGVERAGRRGRDDLAYVGHPDRDPRVGQHRRTVRDRPVAKPVDDRRLDLAGDDLAYPRIGQQPPNGVAQTETADQQPSRRRQPIQRQLGQRLLGRGAGGVHDEDAVDPQFEDVVVAAKHDLAARRSRSRHRLVRHRVCLLEPLANRRR